MKKKKQMFYKRSLVQMARKMNAERKCEIEEQLKELQQIPLQRRSNGEYTPFNCDDFELREWCGKFNRKLRRCKEVIEHPINPIIQTHLSQYYPYSKSDKLLCEWCRNKNKEVRTKSCSEPALKPILISDGKYRSTDENDALLVKWCNKYNDKLQKSKSFVVMHTGSNARQPLWCSNGYFSCDVKESLLWKWCIKRNAEINKLLAERSALNDRT